MWLLLYFLGCWNVIRWLVLVCGVNGLLISQSSSGLSRLWFMGSVICVWFLSGSLWLQQGHPSAFFMRSNGFCLFLNLLPLAPQLLGLVWVPQPGLTLTLCWSRPMVAIALVLLATGSTWWMTWWPLPMNPACSASLLAFLMTSSQSPLSFLSLSCLRGKEKGKQGKLLWVLSSGSFPSSQDPSHLSHIHSFGYQILTIHNLYHQSRFPPELETQFQKGLSEYETLKQNLLLTLNILLQSINLTMTLLPPSARYLQIRWPFSFSLASSSFSDVIASLWT